ncbi:MAG: hypothetical protein KF824_12715 [Fimbriimonadaceae bacterium]|nr:MAG: hypothetical protein KF824_12715 [Fimbriimonadaceae bacterium]
MRVLLYEDNLMWSEKLRKTLLALGHEPVVISRPTKDHPEAPVAIINLGSNSWDIAELIKALQARSTWVIGHAGHKEKEKLEYGKEMGCDYLATNSETTFKLEAILAKFESKSP